MKISVKERIISVLSLKINYYGKRIRYFLLFFGLSLGLLLSLSWVAHSQDLPVLEQEQDSTEILAEKTNKIDGYPVVLDGNTIFVVRQGVGSFSAQDRAEAIAKRIETIAQDSSITIDNLKIIKEPDYGLIYLQLGQDVILTIGPQDAKIYRKPQADLAQEALQNIKNAVQAYRQERNPGHLFRALVYTAISSLALIILLTAMFASSGRLFPAIAAWLEQQVPSVRIQNFEMISPRQISQVGLKILQFIRFFIVLVFVYIYTSFVLGLFPWTKTFSKSILNYFFQAVELIFNAIGQYLPNLIILLVIITITYYTIRSLKPFFTALDRGTLVIPGFYADWAEPTFRLVLILVIAIATVVAFPYLPGFDSPAFKGITVFLGLLFSLGSTSAVSNVVGGVILIYTRAFQNGDRIQVGDVTGDVLEKNLLVTRILTVTNKIITIPNSSMLSSNVINFSIASRELDRYLVLQTTITLGYDLPWQKVYDALIQAALATTSIRHDPSPFVLQTSLDDFYVSYQLNAYTDQPAQMMKIYSELHQNIQDQCNEVGIEIMSPHYSALRDGHQTTIPANYLPDDYRAPGFRLESPSQGSPETPEKLD